MYHFIMIRDKVSCIRERGQLARRRAIASRFGFRLTVRTVVADNPSVLPHTTTLYQCTLVYFEPANDQL